LNYIGIIPAILLIWAAMRVRKRELVFWWTYLVFAVGWYLKVSPFSDILNLAFYPFLHEILPHMMIPLPLCVIIGSSARKLFHHPLRFDKKSITGIFLFFGLVILCLPALFVYSHQQSLQPLKLILLCVVGLIAAVLVLIRTIPGIKRHAGLMIPSLALFFGSSLSLSLLNEAKDSSLFIGVVTGAATIAIISLFWLLIEWCLNGSSIKGKLIMSLCVAAFLALALRSPLVGFTHEHAFRCLVPIGVLRMLIILLLTITLIQYTQIHRMNRTGLYVSLLIILLVDLIGYNKVYSHIVKEPFFKGSTLYGNKSSITSSMKLKNYRVNVPNVYLQILDDPLFYSNIPAVYGVRSFGGVNSDTPKRHSQLLEHLNNSNQQGINLFAYNRMLDIMGCGYNIDRKGKRESRPQALARIMLFKNYEVIPNDQAALNRLTHQSFDPLSTLIINGPPGFSRPSKEFGSQVLNFKEEKSSLLKIEIHSAEPSLLFFGDSYHPDWKAFADGKQVEMIRANFKFMAAALPAGTKSVELRFTPQAFYKGKTFSIFGLIFSLLIACLLAWFYRGTPSLTENSPESY